MRNSHLFLSLQTIIIKVNSNTISIAMTTVTVTPMITKRWSLLFLLSSCISSMSVEKLKTNLVGNVYCLPCEGDVLGIRADVNTVIGEGVNGSVGEDFTIAVTVFCTGDEVVILLSSGILVELLPTIVGATLLMVGPFVLVEPDKKRE